MWPAACYWRVVLAHATAGSAFASIEFDAARVRPSRPLLDVRTAIANIKLSYHTQLTDPYEFVVRAENVNGSEERKR
jgi:hypothetical protein